MNEIVHYKYSSKPVVVATVDMSEAEGEGILHGEVIDFLKSEGVEFDYLEYDENKFRYSAMRFKRGFERCER